MYVLCSLIDPVPWDPEVPLAENEGPETAQLSGSPVADQEMVVEFPGLTLAGLAEIERVGFKTVIVVESCTDPSSFEHATV